MTTPPDSGAAWTPIPSSERRFRFGRWLRSRALGGLVATVALSGGAASCDSCKKKETEPESVVPAEGGATQDVVNTGIGVGLGLPAKLAPTSVTWERVVVINERAAIVAGRSIDGAFALRTLDRGRTWTAFKAKADSWQSWAAMPDASTIFATGKRKKMTARPGLEADVIEASAYFGPESRDDLTEPAPLFPGEADPFDGITIDGGISQIAALTPELLSLVADRKRNAILLYGAPGGQPQPTPTVLPRGRFIRAPHGRPAQLLSLQGTTLAVRPWPKPGEKVDAGSQIPNLVVTRDMAAQLDRGPGCDVGPWSFSRLSASKTKGYVVGVSDTRALSFEVPAFEVPGGDVTDIGCHPEAIVVRIEDPKKKEPKLIRCTLAGKCADPQSNPFELWPEEHEHTIHMVATKQGAVATITAKTGTRHGAYVSTSTDGGATFALARVINEGQTSRGYIEVGALVGFEDRVVMLVSADVTGTQRRGWYVLASDDGGESWGPP